MNSFQKFVNHRLQELHLSRSQLALLLGYHNIAKGLRRLDEYLAAGSPCRQIEENLHTILEVPRDQIQSLLEEVRKARQTPVRTPGEGAPITFLHVVTERSIPSQITLCGILGMDRKKRVPLSRDFWTLSDGERQHMVRDRIRKHWQECHGIIPFFGTIRYYVLMCEPGSPSQTIRVFDPSGHSTENVSLSTKELSVGKAAVFHKHRTIRTALFRH